MMRPKIYVSHSQWPYCVIKSVGSSAQHIAHNVIYTFFFNRRIHYQAE